MTGPLFCLTLPTRACGCDIDPDFRLMAQLGAALERGPAQGDALALVADTLRRFYRGAPPPDMRAAWQGMLDFYAMRTEDGEVLPSNGPRRQAQANARLFDYVVDGGRILADFQQWYGIDLTSAQLHWWRFRALLAQLPERSRFAQAVYYRAGDFKGLPKETQRAYRSLQAAYALPAVQGGGSHGQETFLERMQRKGDEARRAAGQPDGA